MAATLPAMREPSPLPAPLGRHNPRLQRVRRIAAREEPDLTLLDGATLVADAARGGAAIIEVYGIASEIAAIAAIPAIARLARDGKVFVVDDASAQRIAPTRHSQGVVAVVAVPRHTVNPQGVVVFLDDVQDPGNVGGIVRSAAAFGAAGVACSPACADPFSPRALRASAGHALRLPVVAGADFAALAASFQAAGGTVAATGGTTGVPITRWRPTPPVLLVFGNEGAGIGASVRERCDATVIIPIAAAVESLNVAVAAGIVLHALSRAAGGRA